MGASLIVRHAESAVRDALADTRVVVLLGARQVGKSTLLEHIASSENRGRRVITLDDQAVRTAAASDPVGFIAGLSTPVVIDEIQRVPELLTEIKQRVDKDQTAGQFALTGSANLLEMAAVKESLAGRAEYIRLFPFSQGELAGQRETLLELLKGGRFPKVVDAPVGREAYADFVVRGGYPEVQSRTPDRRAQFFDSYIDGILERDVAALRDVSDSAAVRRVLEALAAVSAQELNIEKLSGRLAMPAATVSRYAIVLGRLFLVQSVQAWSNNLLARTIKRPKIHIADTGLLSYLLGIDEERYSEDGDAGGKLTETFVANELIRQASWQSNRPRVFHFRDRDQREVDLVLEWRDGSVVAIEVKAAATVHPQDFRGLTLLRDRLGDRFKAGALMYTGATTLPFGDRLAAVPLAGLHAS